MESLTLYITSLLTLAAAMFMLAQVLQARLNRQLIHYSKGMLRYCPDEKEVEQHLVAHGIKVEQASKIVLAARQRMMSELIETR